jgi:hypothetical protein
MSADDEFDASGMWVSPETDHILRMAGSGNLPQASVAIFARWWQLETWLRELTYVELRSIYGSDWESAAAAAAGRQQQDAKFLHMPSVDSDNPLAYLDYSQLLRLIEDHHHHLHYALFESGSWNSRQDELKRIRHRIGHMRRPHRDDLSRLEQTLRDLERGAYIACASYNMRRTPDPKKHQDPITAGWIDRQHDGARLIDHAESIHDVRFVLSTSRRPWATYPTSLEKAPGVLWHAAFFLRRSTVDVKKLWRDVHGISPLIVHLISDQPGHVEFTFSAVDDAAIVADAIEHAFDCVLGSRWHGPREGVADGVAWQQRMSTIDYRVLSGSLWSLVNETTLPISIFGAGGGVELAPDW